MLKITYILNYKNLQNEFIERIVEPKSKYFYDNLYILEYPKLFPPDLELQYKLFKNQKNIIEENKVDIELNSIHTKNLPLILSLTNQKKIIMVLSKNIVKDFEKIKNDLCNPNHHTKDLLIDIYINSKISNVLIREIIFSCKNLQKLTLDIKNLNTLSD